MGSLSKFTVGNGKIAILLLVTREYFPSKTAGTMVHKRLGAKKKIRCQKYTEEGNADLGGDTSFSYKKCGGGVQVILDYLDHIVGGDFLKCQNLNFLT